MSIKNNLSHLLLVALAAYKYDPEFRAHVDEALDFGRPDPDFVERVRKFNSDRELELKDSSESEVADAI